MADLRARLLTFNRAQLEDRAPALTTLISFIIIEVSRRFR